MEHSKEIKTTTSTSVSSLQANNTISKIKAEINSPLKIRNLQTDEAVTQALAYVVALIGLQKEFLPTGAQRAVLIDFVKLKLANYTANEIKIAFQMAIAGDFKVDLECYGQFSSKYLMSIFNAYLEHRNKIALELEREKKKLESIVDPEEEQRKIDEFFKASCEIYRESKDEFNGTKYHASAIYDTLKLHFSREELIQFKRQAKAELIELKKDLNERMKYGQQITAELAKVSFNETGWRHRTALITANEALKRGVTIKTENQ